MPTLIETSVWIHFSRERSPRTLKEFIYPYTRNPQAHIAEPVIFEVLRHATPEENSRLSRFFETFPLLSTPKDLWREAARLGQACRKQGFTAGSLDLLVAAVALAHKAEVVTFDEDYRAIADAGGFAVEVLTIPK